MHAPHDITQKGNPYAPDSALGMLRTLISEHRRTYNKNIITREDAATLGVDFDTLPKWEPRYLPDGSLNSKGGTHTHTGIVDCIATGGQLHHVAVSAFLSGTEEPHTPYNFMRVLHAINASDDDKNRIMRKLYKEKFTPRSPQALFSMSEFDSIPFAEAMEKLLQCFVYREDMKQMIPVATFLAMLPVLKAEEIFQFSQLSERALSRLLSASSNGMPHIKRVAVSAPFHQLQAYNALGLTCEQAVRMLQKSWSSDAQHWHAGKSSEIIHTTLLDIFTTPPADDPMRFKKRGELLHELRCAHCIYTHNGKAKLILWDDAAQEILDLLRAKGMGAFSNVSIKAVSEQDVADVLKHKKQLVDRWEKGVSKVAGNHIMPLAQYFRLPKIFAQALRNAPDTNALFIPKENGGNWMADAYREHIKYTIETMENPLDIAPESFPPHIERGMHVDKFLSNNWVETVDAIKR